MAVRAKKPFFPITLEPVSAQRIKDWGSFASTSQTQEEFKVVQGVFYSFWFENSAYDGFDKSLQWLANGNEEFAASWFDSLVFPFVQLAENWNAGMQNLTDWTCFYQDAAKSSERAIHNYQVTIDWVIAFCSSRGLGLFESTQKAVAQQYGYVIRV